MCGFLLAEPISGQPAYASDLNEQDLKNREKPFMSAGIGFDYATGDFGTGTTTNFINIPLIIDIFPNDRLDFELTIPFVYQNNSSNFYSGSGEQYQYRNGFMANTMASGKSKQGAMNSDTSGISSDVNPEKQEHNGKDEAVSGLGDITISAGYAALEEGRISPRIRLEAFMKLPTADSDEGLGSGSFDWGPGISFSKWLGSWHLFAQERYIVCGSSDYYDMEDHFTHEAEIGYQIRESFYGALSVYGATESSDDSDTPLEGRMKIRVNLIQEIILETYILKGFSDGSPDFGAGAAIFHDF